MWPLNPLLILRFFGRTFARLDNNFQNSEEACSCGEACVVDNLVDDWEGWLRHLSLRFAAFPFHLLPFGRRRLSLCFTLGPRLPFLFDLGEPVTVSAEVDCADLVSVRKVVSAEVQQRWRTAL